MDREILLVAYLWLHRKLSHNLIPAKPINETWHQPLISCSTYPGT